MCVCVCFKFSFVVYIFFYFYRDLIQMYESNSRLGIIISCACKIKVILLLNGNLFSFIGELRLSLVSKSYVV